MGRERLITECGLKRALKVNNEPEESVCRHEWCMYARERAQVEIRA